MDHFVKVRKIMDVRNIHLSDAEVLVRLRLLLDQTGYLKGLVINHFERLPSDGRVAARSGSCWLANLLALQPVSNGRGVELDVSPDAGMWDPSNRSPKRLVGGLRMANEGSQGQRPAFRG